MHHSRRKMALRRLAPKEEFHQETKGRPRKAAFVSYCSFAYSAFACFSMGTSGSASFHSVKNSS